MNVPWRFLSGLVAGFVLCVTAFVVCLYTQVGVPTRLSQWAFDIAHQKEQLASEITGPRLLVVGGSGTLFGVNAQLIQQKTGLPTINMATTAGLTFDYRLYWLKKIVRPGDIILLVLEYDTYNSGTSKFSEFNDNYILSRAPDYFYRMSWPEKISMATRVPFKRLQEGWKYRRNPESARIPSPPYTPYTPITPGIDCLDDNGDEVFNVAATRHPSAPELKDMADLLLNGAVSERNADFDRLAAFIQWAQLRHITILSTFPNIVHQPAYDQPNALQAIATITHFYTSHGVPMIGTAQEAMLPVDQFYDTMYHLTYESALQRTGRLIPELEPYLPVAK